MSVPNERGFRRSGGLLAAPGYPGALPGFAEAAGELPEIPTWRRVWLWAPAVWINLAIAFLSFAAGVVTGGLGGARMHIAAAGAARLPVLADYVSILARNEAALLRMVTGLPFVGVVGNVIVGQGWFRFGSDLTSLSRADSRFYLLVRGPLQLGLLTLGAAAMQSLAYRTMSSMVLKGSALRWKRSAKCYVVCGVLLIVAAAFEVMSKSV